MEKPQYVIDAEAALNSALLCEDFDQAEQDLVDALREWESDMEEVAA